MSTTRDIETEIAHQVRQAENALKRAEGAAKRNDIALAERWSKVAKMAAEAARTLDALPKPEENIEELREEFMRRFERWLEAEKERAEMEVVFNGGALPPPAADAE